MRRKYNKKPKLHVKKGDQVKVLSGINKGMIGKILVVYPLKQKALVQGLNMITKHIKPNTNEEHPGGGRIQTEAPLNVSKLQIIDPRTNKPSRIGRRKTDTGWKRYTKKYNNVID